MRFVYLPPYSPNLNRIERLWKFCKKKMLSVFYATFPRFTQAIDAFFADRGRYQDALTTLMTEKVKILTRS